ncbi:MAG: hypothetical protein BGO69_18855 [Bacteroidetes bacterium 46-16]|nr:MAG: hypothetical protein BGO69_18855 [Bacteroidetes bacterium 46-16]
MSKCALCLAIPADKRNSHIIPKFLCKSLFHKEPYRHAVSVTRGLKLSKIQDTPKEDYLLCSGCEQRMSIIESVFARYFDQIHSYKTNKSVIQYVKAGNYLICNHINPTLFKLFIYSILWRLSRCSLEAFKSFKFEDEIEEELRVFINDNLKSTKQELISNLQFISWYPLYELCLLKPENRLYPPRSFMSAYSFNQEQHLVMFSEFSLFVATRENVLNQVLEFYSNKQNNDVIIGMGKEDAWDYFNDMLLSKFRQSI